MAIRVGINGFGRIGRNVFRAGINNKNIEFVAVNDLPVPLESHAYLLKYDSILGTFQGSVKVEGDSLVVNGKSLKMMNYKDPAQIPWGQLGVDIADILGYVARRERRQVQLGRLPSGVQRLDQVARLGHLGVDQLIERRGHV
jgi:glyceraldehyde 3-phosphate dehydrogenase